MKPFTWALILNLVLFVAAGPVPESMVKYLNRQVTVTTEEVNLLDFYAEYAGSSYCNSDTAIGTRVTCSDDFCPLVEKAGATVAATFTAKVTDVQGYVAIDDMNKLIVASFRGSHSIRNWVTNFVFLQEPCDIVDGCLVHAGFAKGYKEISDSLIAAMTKAKADHPDYSIIFTGHSLGAAMATLAAAHLREMGFASDIYGYGSPRVGNRAFVDHVSKQAGGEYRVTHLSDPVPRLPPIFTNYRHTSPEYWLANGKSTTVDYKAAEIKVCEGYASLKCNGGTLGLDIEAHGHYFTSISACSPNDMPFKRATEVQVDQSDVATTDMNDEELESHLNEYVKQDEEAVAAMTDVWG